MWHSADIHAYTPAIRARVPDANRVTSAAVAEMDAPGLSETLADMLAHFKTAPAETAAVRNIESVLKNRPPDPQLPDLDLATCLRAVWWHARRRETDLLAHVAETLRWIGQTCPQGVSHRIVQDATMNAVFASAVALLAAVLLLAAMYSSTRYSTERACDLRRARVLRACPRLDPRDTIFVNVVAGAMATDGGTVAARTVWSAFARADCPHRIHVGVGVASEAAAHALAGAIRSHALTNRHQWVDEAAAAEASFTSSPALLPGFIDRHVSYAVVDPGHTGVLVALNVVHGVCYGDQRYYATLLPPAVFAPGWDTALVGDLHAIEDREGGEAIILTAAPSRNGAPALLICDDAVMMGRTLPDPVRGPLRQLFYTPAFSFARASSISPVLYGGKESAAFAKELHALAQKGTLGDENVVATDRLLSSSSPSLSRHHPRRPPQFWSPAGPGASAEGNHGPGIAVPFWEKEEYATFPLPENGSRGRGGGDRGGDRGGDAYSAEVRMFLGVLPGNATSARMDEADTVAKYLSLERAVAIGRAWKADSVRRRQQQQPQKRKGGGGMQSPLRLRQERG